MTHGDRLVVLVLSVAVAVYTPAHWWILGAYLIGAVLNYLTRSKPTS